MTVTFWTLYVPIALALCAVSLLVRYAQLILRRWQRRRFVRREVAAIRQQKVEEAFWEDIRAHGKRRAQLENAATSQDRYSRRLH